MSDRSTWHRISEVDSEVKLGTCSQCGPGVPLHFRAYNSSWVCATARNSGRREPHGLTRSEAQALREGKCCRICGSTENLVVDHCHETGKIRGVLCRDHNIALGLFGDDVDLLCSAVFYLLRVDVPLTTL